MENFEDDGAEVVATTITDLEVELITMENTSSTVQRTEHLDNDVVLLEPTVDFLDLTSPPQPSTSSSGGAIGAAACSLLKTEEAAADTLTSAALDQNPCSSSASAVTAPSTTLTTNILECPICLQTCIHPARLPCGHIFCFLCVKGVAYKNRRCAMCRREIPPEFLDNPQLVNGIEDICTTKATDDGYQWFYEGRNGGWWAYEERNAAEIEDAYQRLLNKQTQTVKQMKKEENETKDEVKIEVKTEVKNEDEIEADNEDENDDDDDIEFLDELEDEDDDEDNYFPNNRNYFNHNRGPMNYSKTNNDENPLTYNIQICSSTYTVDFKNMIQYPQYEPNKKRKICRAKGLIAKGVAGLSSGYSKKNYRMRPY